jgi:hypothetical protein
MLARPVESTCQYLNNPSSAATREAHGRMCLRRMAPAQRVGGAFRALLANVYPGLKPWANLCYRFAAKHTNSS